jgi:hypothetical protein
MGQLGSFPDRQPRKPAAHLPVADERPPAIAREAVPRDLDAVQFLGCHGFHRIPPQRGDATTTVMTASVGSKAPLPM